jgi:hypothetical protein
MAEYLNPQGSRTGSGLMNRPVAARRLPSASWAVPPTKLYLAWYALSRAGVSPASHYETDIRECLQ